MNLLKSRKRWNNTRSCSEKRFSNLFGFRKGEPLSVKETIGHTLKPGESVNPETHIEVQVMEDGKKLNLLWLLMLTEVL